MNKILDDYRTLLHIEGELGYKAECGQNYEDMYYGVLDELIELFNKYDIEFDENEIDWDWCNYIQSKEWELEKKLQKLLNLG